MPTNSYKFANKYEDNGEILDKWSPCMPFIYKQTIWVVFIVDTGVGHGCEFQGLHIIGFTVSALKTKLFLCLY